MTKQIKSLENELCIQLFYRINKKSYSNSSRKNFYKNVLVIVHELKNATKGAQNVHRNTNGQIHIGYIGHTYEKILPPILKEFNIRYPSL